jgi:glycosyltransferase involved in cell wall biosynthesis
MKVLYFHQYFNTPRGAGGLRSYEFGRALVNRGHDVSIVCVRHSGAVTGLEDKPFDSGMRRGKVDGLTVIEFDLPYSNHDAYLRRTLTFLRYSGRSARLALTDDYDVVFATTTPLTAGIPGILARWFRRKPFVFEVRDLWPELPRAMGVIRNPLVLALMSALEWMSYRSAHALVGLSPGMVEGIAHRGVSRDRISLIPNGCDLDIFGTPSSGWRPEGVRPNDLMAVFAGTHGVANGLDAALDAAAVLKERGRDDIRLVLIGDGKLKPALVQRARAAELSNVVFHEPVSKLRLSGLLAAADLGLQVMADVPAFYYGTSPNKFFDFIAAGLPVLTNYPGWLADMINARRCGYAVSARNANAFADALEHAADHRTELVEMGRRSSALAREEFDRQLLAAQFVDTLEHLVRGAAPRNPEHPQLPATDLRAS